MKSCSYITALIIFSAVAAFAQIPTGDGYTTPSRPAGSSASMSNEPVNVKIANLSEDSKSNQKDIQVLTLRVEQLERDKAALEAKLNAGGNYVSKDELKLTEARINEATTKAIADESKRVENEILEQIKAAKKSVAKASVPTTPATTSKTAATLSSATTPAASSVSGKIPVSEAEKASYMKEGIRYTVQPGDSLTSIAKRYHSSVRAIMVANDIATPNKLFVGKELFVPSLEK